VASRPTFGHRRRAASAHADRPIGTDIFRQRPGPDCRTAQRTGAALGISPELQQKFESLQDDIADVRCIVEQIAIRQEQMTESVVALQAAQQTLTQKLSPPQTAAASAVSHARKSTYPEAAAVPRPIPASPPRSH